MNPQTKIYPVLMHLYKHQPPKQ